MPLYGIIEILIKISIIHDNLVSIISVRTWKGLKEFFFIYMEAKHLCLFIHLFLDLLRFIYAAHCIYALVANAWSKYISNQEGSFRLLTIHEMDSVFYKMPLTHGEQSSF